MNIKLIAIAAALLFLLVVLTPDSHSERRARERERAKSVKDPLVESITEYNNKTGKFAPSFFGFGGSGKTSLSQEEQGEAPANYLPVQSNPHSQPAVNATTPPAEQPQGNQGYAPPPAQASEQQPEREGYYPPPPLPSGR